MHSRRYAICDYEVSTAHTHKRRDLLWQHPATEVPKPKHAVSEGLLALAEDKRPEANRSF
jgi:hypothetical protein